MLSRQLHGSQQHRERATTSGGTTGSGGGVACGGIAGATCPADEFCDYASDDCGGGDGQGTCKPRPVGCDDSYVPACACNGMVYANTCDANAAGFDRSNNGGCPPPMERFPCGWTFCTFDSYCERSTSDIGGFPDGYACKLLPAGCANGATCACLATEPCGSLCEADAAGHLELTCPGG
ncbi:MAG: hypothetical protein U0414_35065 [Polyangiaceae bacterium]